MEVNNLERVMTPFDAYKKYAKGKKGIIYVKTVQAAANFSMHFCSMGVGAFARISSVPAKRQKELIEKFKEEDKNVQILISVAILEQGYNFPNIEFVMIAKNITNPDLYRQIAGRLMQLSSKEEKPILIDLFGVSTRLERYPSETRVYNIVIPDRPYETDSISSCKHQNKRVSTYGVDKAYWYCPDCKEDVGTIS